MEIFKECLFNNGYLIGDNGTVKSLSKQRLSRYGTDILIGLIKSDGYKMYFIKGKWHYAHRLVALHYIDNPNGLSDVNHKDGVKLNNHWSNLEWLSHSDNCKHSYDVLGRVAPGGLGHYNKGKKASDKAKANMSNAKKGWKREGFSGKWIKP